jgi:hypothetical protein
VRNSDQNGAGTVEAVLFLVIVAIIGATGWYVWRTTQQTNKTIHDTSSVAQSPRDKKAITDPKTGWLRYTTPGGEYSVSLPDGWQLNRIANEPDLVAYTNDLDVQKGKTAQVHQVGGGKDGMTTGIIVVYDVPKNITDPRADAEKTPSFYTEDGLLVEVHRYIEETGGDFLGDLPKGTREYTYRIHQVTNGHILQVTYLCPPDGPDHHEIVEGAVKTISIPK